MLGVKETVLCYCCVCVCVCVCVILRTQDKLGPWSPTNHVVTICLSHLLVCPHKLKISLSLSLSCPPLLWLADAVGDGARALLLLLCSCVCVQSAPTREFETPKAGSSSWSPYNGNCVYTCIYIYIYTHIHI